MRIRLILSMFLIWNNLLTGQEVRIISDFESASIGSLKEIAPNKFKGQTMHWIKHDQIGNQYYWFYFKVVNVKNKTVDFELDNLVGTYRGDPHICYTDFTKPVLSYDNQSWTRIDSVKYDDENYSFHFKTHFKHDTAWIAYAHPYPYSRYMRYLESVKSNPFLKIIEEGRTPEARSIPFLEISNFDSVKDKKRIFVMAMQHSGEDAGGYSVEGMINFLLSDNKEAKRIRENYSYYFIPMMNPDGVYHGVSRYTPKMQDLNDEWIREDSDKLEQPLELEFVKRWLKKQYNYNDTIDLFVDFHCHLQKSRDIAFLDKSKDKEALKGLLESMKNFWPHIRYAYRPYPGRRSGNFTTQFGIPSLTVELTQSYEMEGSRDYFNIDDYRIFGEDMIKAITIFFEN